MAAVLFDLDGTLIDTVHDFAQCANQLRAARGLHPLATEVLREAVTLGADAILDRALDLRPGDAGHADVRAEFLDLYEKNLAATSTLFEGVDEVLTRLESKGITWGIVTNKPRRFTVPLVHILGLDQRAWCVISGDTTAHAKPHPDPLRLAASEVRVAPAQCVYVGDAETDVEAARAAGMASVVALFGYLPAQADPTRWGADYLITHPRELLGLLGQDE